MSLLAPLYALAALAVLGPVLFHLIRRQPRGRVPFSSLMFLTPSPPRLTRRSRLDNLLLLLLRALALLLIAVAFARPFLRAANQSDTGPAGRSVLALLDTSASMQRAGLWSQATDQLQQLVASLQPTDRLELATFDNAYRTVIDLDDPLPPARRRAAVDAALSRLQPTSAATDLGGALVAAAEALNERSARAEAESAGGAQIVLITDMQAGAELDALQGYQWPSDLALDVRTVTPDRPTNAAAFPLPFLNDAAEESGDEVRVRVINAADSRSDQFRLAWDGESAEDASEGIPVQVPPGESRVVRVPLPEEAAARLRLAGDDQPFDNDRFLVRPRQRSRGLLFLGDSDEAPRSSLAYYLERAALDNLWQAVALEVRDPAEPLTPPSVEQVPLVVVAEAVPAENRPALTEFLRAGGHVLQVLTSSDELAGAESLLRDLSGEEDVRLGPAEVDDYAMLSEIDFRHPLFAPFADPRFNDFTKIRFWTHRRIELGEDSEFRVVARFDDRSPAYIERGVGEGRLSVLAAGWQPEESQLALSSKFVPLVAGWFDPRGGRRENAGSYEVGDPVPLGEMPPETEIVLPDGSRESLGEQGARFVPERPGIYRITGTEPETAIAVNLPRAESLTEPLDPQQLEALGVRLGATRTAEELAAAERQMRDRELEGRQKLWRVLLTAALAVLAVETVLGGWLGSSKRAAAEAAS